LGLSGLYAATDGKADALGRINAASGVVGGQQGRGLLTAFRAGLGVASDKG
jgi:hypothetical protein